MKAPSAATAAVRDRNTGPVQVTGDELLPAPEEELSTLPAGLWPDPVGELWSRLELEAGVDPVSRLGHAGVLVPGDQLHDPERAHAQLIEPLENEVVEDQPREVTALDELLHVLYRLLEVLKGAAAERAAPFDELIEVDLGPAARAGGMGGKHACHDAPLVDAGVPGEERDGIRFRPAWQGESFVINPENAPGASPHQP
jgi:hypothetical protein